LSRMDPVRFLTNRSSGAMGEGLAWAAAARGYSVTAVCGPCDVVLPPGAERVDVETADEMAEAVRARQFDVFIGAAAVLDWEFGKTSPVKLKRESGTPAPEWKKSRDILAEVCSSKTRGQFVLGFAAETDEVLRHGRAKLLAKGCDAIFVNDVSRTDR